MIPLTIFLPAKLAIKVSENMVTVKYSHAPNLIVMLARGGAIKIIAAIPRTVPINEKTTPTPSALPPSPLSANGRPSKQVAIEEGVPGIFNKIADTKPPDIPPIYKATKEAIPMVVGIEKVIGSIIAMAIVAVSPGIAPKIIPMPVHKKINTMLIGSDITALIP